MSYIELCRIVQERLAYHTVESIRYYVPKSPPVESSQPVESSSRVNDTVGGSEAVGGINESNIDVGPGFEAAGGPYNGGKSAINRVPQHVCEPDVYVETDDEVETKEEQVCETEGVRTAETEHIVHTECEVDREIENEDEENVYLVKVRYLSDDEGDPDPLKNVRKRKRTKLEAYDSDNGYGTEHYYDTDDALSSEGTDSDGENAATRKSRFPQHKSDQVVPEFCVRMVFKDGTDFKTVVHRYSVYIKRELKIVKNEPKRISVKCVSAAHCNWRIYASYSKEARGIQVKTYFKEHSCPMTFKNKAVNVKLIAKRYESSIKKHRKITMKDLAERVKEDLDVEVNLTRCKRAKHMVFEKFAGNFIKKYAQLRDYVNELLEKNPGSRVVISTDRDTPESAPWFKRIYICLHAVKKGFKNGCRPFVGLDGCFLKGPYKGELLSAVRKDGNHQMYPVAWAVVESESIDSWTWFLELLSKNLGLRDGHRFTIMSDKQKEDNFEKLKKLDEQVAKELMKRNPKQWTKAFQTFYSKCDVVDNNMCEAFNASIVDARHKAIITMLEEIRVGAMKRIVERRSDCRKWKVDYGPLIKDKFDKIKSEAVKWRVTWNGEKGYEVSRGRFKYTINLRQKLCSCRLWQISRIPCVHATCVIWHDGGDPDKYLHKWYNTNTYMKAYENALQPINGANEWKKCGLDTILPPLVPKKSTGRPKKK
ncbi:hypothetical protein PTKIN_Ptkin09bG0164000 [Pterospermum kingtungense]